MPGFGFSAGVIAGNRRGLPGWLVHPSALVDMDFAGGRYYGKQLADLSVVRASAGYAQDLAGVWQTFGANIPRLTDRGLLVESARTNLVRNNALAGAIGGTPGTLPTNWQVFAGGGLSRTTSIATVNGMDVLRVRIFGTATVTTGYAVYFDTATGIAASTGQTIAMSISACISAGSLANIGVARFNAIETTSAGAAVRTNYSVVNLGAGLTGAMARYSGVVTLSGGATVASLQPALEIWFNAGAVIDVTFDLAWPQIEVGAYATSPIRTTGTAQTRAADVVSAALVGVPAAYTLVGKARESASGGSIFEASDGSNSNRGLVQKSGLNVRRFVATGGATVVDAIATPAGGWGTASAKTALAMGANAVRTAFGGALLAAADDAVAVPASGPTRLGVGSSGNGSSSYFEGYIERVSIIPSRIANSELQAVTT